MKRDKTLPSGARGEPLRQAVLDAAERLLRNGKAGFSMRDLAMEAGVSFATPFNQFGSKAAIMHVLSARRIATMATRFAAATRPVDTVERVLLAVSIGVEVMLDEPEVNRAIMGWLGTAGSPSATVLAQSSELWRTAFADGKDLIGRGRNDAMPDLPKTLALLFRGVLSFWTAGEIADAELAAVAREAALTLLSRHCEAPDPQTVC